MKMPGVSAAPVEYKTRPHKHRAQYLAPGPLRIHLLQHSDHRPSIGLLTRAGRAHVVALSFVELTEYHETLHELLERTVR